MKLIFASVLSSFLISASAQEVGPLNFQEVFSLVRTNVADISEEDLSRAAALGLIRELGTKVQLVTSNASSAALPSEVISRRAVYEGAYNYLQVRLVDDRLPSEFQEWVTKAISTNNSRGLILDLRFAQGESYPAAAKVADLFSKGGEALLKLGPTEIRSSEKSSIVDQPVAVLANNETRGAAEVLAAMLRETGVGLIIGATTAGEARLFETFKLSTGQQLKIGTVPVEFGKNKTIPAKGLVPDVAVTVNPAAEKIFYQDPFRMVSAVTGQVSTNSAIASTTNRSRRFNEAELVRRHRLGTNIEELNANPNSPDERTIPDEPIINDPVPARALDFLKGISALQQHRPQ